MNEMCRMHVSAHARASEMRAESVSHVQRYVGRLLAMLSRRHVQATAVLKILLGYLQCMSIFARLDKVRWPPVFLDFLSYFDYFSLDLFSFLPVQCAIGGEVRGVRCEQPAVLHAACC